MTNDMQKLLILDLDETLFHATKTPLSIAHDFMVEDYFVYKRPHVDAFIDFCRQHFSLAVWTSSSDDYAAAIVKELFGNRDNLAFLWHRQQCITRFAPETGEYLFIKDLKKLKRKGFSLDHVIALDDSPEKLQRNYGNLLRISPFFDDKSDDELQRIMPFLLTLKDAPNIRNIEKRNWRRKN
ncbi:MAG: HAD family hydrolase [Mariprofundaceae bacterium]